MERKETTKKAAAGGFSPEKSLYSEDERRELPKRAVAGGFSPSKNLSSSNNVPYNQPSYISSPYNSAYYSQTISQSPYEDSSYNGQFSPQKLVQSEYFSSQSTYNTHLEKPKNVAANPELVFNRNTNSTECFVQQGNDNSFAFAATSAYINTCNRIFGSQIPTFDECFPIADYNRGRPGEITTALNLLENRFKIGVRYEQTPKYQIPNIESI